MNATDMVVFRKSERIKFVFGASDSFWLRAAQAAVIEWRLDKHPSEFSVRSVDYLQEGRLVFELHILETSERLWSEKKIVDLILACNPVGFYLIFRNAVVEFAQEKVAPLAKEFLTYVTIVAVVVFGVWVYAKTRPAG